MAGTSEKNYYEYMFQPDKKPTKQLDSLLRGIANYIVGHGILGAQRHKILTRNRLTQWEIKTTNILHLPSSPNSIRRLEGIMIVLPSINLRRRTLTCDYSLVC